MTQRSSFLIEAKLQEAANSGGVPETLMVPRVLAWAGIDVRVDVGNPTEGKSATLSFVVLREAEKKVKLRVFHNNQRTEKQEGLDSKALSASVTFTKSITLGETEKVVFSKHSDGAPRQWIEVKVTEAPLTSSPVIPVPPIAITSSPPPTPVEDRYNLGGKSLRGLQFRHRVASDGLPTIDLSYGDLQAEGKRFQIGSGEQAYTFGITKSGMGVKGPAVQTVCTEMAFTGGLVVKAEPFTTTQGHLRAYCRSEHPNLIVIEWGDAVLLCSKLSFTRNGEKFTLAAGSGDFTLMRKRDMASETVVCKELILNFELDTLTADGAGSIQLSK